MQVTVQKLSPVLVEFDVEVTADRVKTELDKAFTNLAKSARVKGFRPGKAPRKVLKTMFGARVAADVAQRLVDETFPKAVTDQKLQPVSNPAFEPKELIENKPFLYKARFEIVPEIDAVNYDGLEAKRPKVDVTDEQVNEQLEATRREHSTLEAPKAPRAAKEGDVVTVDFDVLVGGDAIADAGAKDFQVELGSGTLLEGIDTALRDKKIGDKAEALVEMPAQHPHAKLRGKTATFALTVTDMKERVLPALDDELAKDVGEFDTLDALKASIRAELEKAQKEQSENTVAEQLVVALVEKNPIPVPPTLVERQMRITEQEVVAQARRQGQSVSGVGDELRENIRKDSEVKVRAGLLMAEIAKKEGLKIGEPEIEEGLKELSEQTGKNVAKLKAEYSDPRRREMLVGMILENKVLDIIEAKSKIEDEK